jgi:hypothetical protein
MPELLAAGVFCGVRSAVALRIIRSPMPPPKQAPPVESLLITTRAAGAPPGFILGNLLARQVNILEGSTHFGDSRVDHESPKKRNVS